MADVRARRASDVEMDKGLFSGSTRARFEVESRELQKDELVVDWPRRREADITPQRWDRPSALPSMSGNMPISFTNFEISAVHYYRLVGDFAFTGGIVAFKQQPDNSFPERFSHHGCLLSIANPGCELGGSQLVRYICRFRSSLLN